MHSKNTQGTSLNSLPVAQHVSKGRTCGRSVTAQNKNVHRCGFVAWAATCFEPDNEIRLQVSLTCPTHYAADVTKGSPHQPPMLFRMISVICSVVNLHTRTSFVWTVDKTWLKHWMHSTPSTCSFPPIFKLHNSIEIWDVWTLYTFISSMLCYAKLTGCLCPLQMWHRSTRK